MGLVVKLRLLLMQLNKTKGMVMLYNQRPINALFHSDGGGYTEDSVNVWGSDVPYLKGVKDFSTGTSTSNWTVTTSRQALESKLNAQLVKVLVN